MRARILLLVLVALLSAGCAHTVQHGMVEGQFSTPGRAATDLGRGGLNFSTGAHGNGHGQTARINAVGAYSLTLPVGTYTVIGALAGQPIEACQETTTVVVTAKTTTHVDFVCHTTQATSPTP